MSLDTRILEEIFNFYTTSSDFNGVPLTTLAKKLEIDYVKLLSLLQKFVENDEISIQVGHNPHILHLGHYEKAIQVDELRKAMLPKRQKMQTINISGGTKLEIQQGNHSLICAYPSQSYLSKHLVQNNFDLLPFKKRLAYGDGQLQPVFFELSVLERYFNDPRYHFKFEDYSGQISIFEDGISPSSLKDSDKIFLKTFGLGHDENGHRVAVVYLRYLASLSSDHQLYWYSKQIERPCKMFNEYYRNTILGEWVSSQSLFTAFIEEQRIICEMSKAVTGRTLFRQTFEGTKRPKEFTFFMSPTLVSYQNFISLLDKMVSENINRDFFKGQLDDFELLTLSDGTVERKLKGSLRMLDEWLKTNYHMNDHTLYDRLMSPFRNIRKQRQAPAHKISPNKYDTEYYKRQMEILGKAHESLVNLRFVFQSHPSSSIVEVPNWIRRGEIKNF